MHGALQESFRRVARLSARPIAAARDIQVSRAPLFVARGRKLLVFSSPSADAELVFVHRMKNENTMLIFRQIESIN